MEIIAREGSARGSAERAEAKFLRLEIAVLDAGIDVAGQRSAQLGEQLPGETTFAAGKVQ
jgi:hypothetical protein